MKKLHIVTVTINLEVEIDEDATTLADFITECDYDFKSCTDGAVVRDMHWIDFDDKEVEI